MSTSSQNSSPPTEKNAKAPSRSRGLKRVSALLDGASAVFAEAGYEAATMTQIAARAGASIGSLYQFFPTKEHVAAALHGRHLDALAGMLDSLAGEVRGQPVEAAVDALFARFVAYLEENPAFLAVGERRSLDPAVKKEARARLRGRIAALLVAVEPPIAEARVASLAAVTLHLIRVAALLRADDDEGVRAPAIAELRTMLKRHLAGQGG
ncbi:TetR/AcrR family transcriptional regulator [Bosea sp. FBZP-16]|uniref:TetR/AcrR family transcriptional regulator n=1 Tax=Bosea sp. FBZP-16 TaxID=2065382 RepID=UPI000C313917|nr:TetR/AcrR family transcriptional regulator [Bosea sp. FBZP-16]